MVTSVSSHRTRTQNRILGQRWGVDCQEVKSNNKLKFGEDRRWKLKTVLVVTRGNQIQCPKIRWENTQTYADYKSNFQEDRSKKHNSNLVCQDANIFHFIWYSQNAILYHTTQRHAYNWGIFMRISLHLYALMCVAMWVRHKENRCFLGAFAVLLQWPMFIQCRTM